MQRWALIALGLAASASVADAQGRSRPRDTVPAGFAPPPGMCRIWLPAVPPSQQPAPTDCATAIRRRPAEGRVVFGEAPAARRLEEAREPAEPGPVRELRPAPRREKKAEEARPPRSDRRENPPGRGRRPS